MTFELLTLCGKDTLDRDVKQVAVVWKNMQTANGMLMMNQLLGWLQN